MSHTELYTKGGCLYQSPKYSTQLTDSTLWGSKPILSTELYLFSSRISSRSLLYHAPVTQIAGTVDLP